MSPLGYTPPMECIECHSTNFEQREVTLPIEVDGHEVTHKLVASVCVDCEWWSAPCRDLERLELLTAQTLLLKHPCTEAIGKFARKALGLSRAALAERLGVTEETVVAWEVSDIPPAWVPLALGTLVKAELEAPPKPTPLVYRALIVEEPDGWTVEFPDCPGCFTCGDTFEEAYAMAKEAVEGWLECHVESGPMPPKPEATEGFMVAIDQELSDAIRRLWVS